MIPDTASVLTNLLSLLLKLEALKIRKNGVQRDLILMNVEASLVCNHRNLQLIKHDKDYNCITHFLVHIIEETVHTTI